MSKKHKNHLDLDWIQELVSFWQRKLGLGAWTILVEEQTKERGDIRASTSWADHYRHAKIKVYPCIVEPPEMASRSICHELVHLVFADLWDLVEQELAENGRLYQQFQQAMETGTDHMATVVWRALKDEPDLPEGGVYSRPT